MSTAEIITDHESKMQKALEHLYQDLRSVRAGKANVSILDAVRVDFYGQKSPLSQVASLGAPNATTLVIDPWDKSLIKVIEKAIEASDLQLNPNNDGSVIRLNIPAPTEERRKELLKIAKKRVEEAKVAIRNIRRDANEKIKKLEKDGDISEDDSKKSVDKVQHLTDHFVQKMDETYTHKEKEILEV